MPSKAEKEFALCRQYVRHAVGEVAKVWAELPREQAELMLYAAAGAYLAGCSDGKYGGVEMPAWPQPCDVPPPGWKCTRGSGHEGPCAAIAAKDDVPPKRFFVFSAVGHSGKGGWMDFSGSFYDETEAVAFAHKNYSGRGFWWEVVDICQEKVIRSSY